MSPSAYRTRVLEHAAALLFTAAAVALRAVLDPWLGSSRPLATLYGGVAAAVWVGGAGPGLLSMAVGLLVSHHLFVEPRGSLVPSGSSDWIGVVAYVFSAGFIVVFGEALRRARRRADSLRVELQQRLDDIRALSDLVPAAVFVGDATAAHIVGNRAACRLLGVAEGSNLSKSAPDEAQRPAGYRAFRHGEELAAEDLPMQRAAREGVAVEAFEHEIVFDDGRAVTLLASATPLFGPDGRVRSVIAVSADVTPLRRSQDALLEIKQLFEAFVGNAPMPAFLKDFAGRYVLVNRAVEQLFESKSEEWIGRRDDEIFEPETARAVTSADDAVRERQEPMQFVETLDTPSGRRQYVVNKFPVRDAAGRLFVGGVALDVTDRLRAEDALRESEQRFRVAQELSLDGFTILRAVRDDAGRIADFEWTFVNPEAGRILQHEPGALVGRRLLDVLPGSRGSSDLFERYVRVADSGEPHDVELFYDADGICGWFRNMTVRLGDGVAVSIADITARKELEIELQARTESLAIADRRKSEFLAMLAHELRNPLGVLVHGLEYLEQGGGAGASSRVLQLMGRQLATMKRLVDDLLDANRIAQGKLELQRARLEVASVVAQAVEAVGRRAELARQHLVVSLPSEPLHVRGDAVRLAQALGNLLDNACKFTPAGGTIEVVAAREEGDAVLRVRDDGAGIAPEELPRIFDLFAQGDPAARVPGRGLGVGLALVRRLVELHGGQVSAHSDGPGRGSEFTIRLPVDGGDVAAQSAFDKPATTSSP